MKGLPKGSNVVPFRVCYGFWVKDYNRLPKKELHRRVWVELCCSLGVVGDGVRVPRFRVSGSRLWIFRGVYTQDSGFDRFRAYGATLSPELQ